VPDARRSVPRPEPPIVPASCSLDAAGLRAQRARYARLAPGVLDVQLSAGRLRVTFGAGFDGRALAEALAVERECCPFYRFELDPLRRQLRITVAGAEHRPALAALALSLGNLEAGEKRH
jgi:hypothetical protein